MTRAWLGVDVGGTWMRVAALDEAGRVVRTGRFPAGPRERLPESVRSVARSWRLEARGMVLGSTGFGRAADRSRLARALRAVAPKARVLTDLDLAWRAALGGPGVLILAGTGSLAFGRDGCGHAARVGGLGPYLGDEGSAFWIGREWLRTRPEKEALAYAHRPRPQAAIASLARRVLRLSRGGGAEAKAAKRIVVQAQNALVLQARAAASLLHFKGAVPLSWHGGVLEDPIFRAGVLRRLGPRFDPRPPASTPERAAAGLALRLAKFPRQ